jgi:hypothetical protein
MTYCDIIDYSNRDDNSTTLFISGSVTQETITHFKQAVPPSQVEYVFDGDKLAIYHLKDPAGGISGTLVIWLNKGKACINTDTGRIWGDWKDDEELLLTEDYEEAQDLDGKSVMGRVAYNIFGMRGIYTQKNFYTLLGK